MYSAAARSSSTTVPWSPAPCSSRPAAARSSAVAGRIEICPLSSVVTSVRTIDRPRPVAGVEVEPGLEARGRRR